MELPEGFIDIHSHLLPGVDDGSEDIEMSLELIDQGMEDGIRTWMLTPHVLDGFTKELDNFHTQRFEELLEAVDRRGIDVELHLASEIMFQGELEIIQSRRTSTYGNNGKYLLMEFPMSAYPRSAGEVFFEFQMAGLRPIVAHPERNTELMKDVRLIQSMVDRGLYMQINARSLTHEGSGPVRRTAEILVKSGGAHFVASDAHNPSWRPALLREAFERVAELTDEANACRLFIDNPRAAIEGGTIDTSIPDLPDQEPWWQKLYSIIRG
jgi:protein-tyrosine phosphatase